MNLTTSIEYGLVAKESARELKLLLKLKAPDAAAAVRKPLNIGVVVDRSGSMAGDKLENTKRALKTLITHLGPQDLLSIVLFDDTVDTLLEPSHVADKDALKGLVDKVTAGGSTNLSAGWVKGLHYITRNAGNERISRCLLLTDGQANVGIQDPAQLGSLGGAARRERNTVTTTLGFGEGFNEDLLTKIARESGGGFYFVDTADKAPAIFAEELQSLLKLVAQNIELVLRPSGAVRMVAQWTDYPAKGIPGGIAFSLGDAYASEEKNVLLSLHIPGLKRLGAKKVAELELTFAEIGGQELAMKTIHHDVRIDVVELDEARQAKPDVEVLQHYGLQLSARARKKAIEEADRGDYKKARATLRNACETLASMPAACADLADEVKELAAQEKLMEDATYAHTRKVMSEVAYDMSTSRMDKIRNARIRRGSA